MFFHVTQCRHRDFRGKECRKQDIHRLRRETAIAATARMVSRNEVPATRSELVNEIVCSIWLFGEVTLREEWGKRYSDHLAAAAEVIDRVLPELAKNDLERLLANDARPVAKLLTR